MKKRCKLPIAMVSIYIFLISSIAFLFTGMLIVLVVNDYKLPDGFNINDFYYVAWMGMIGSFCLTMILTLLEYIRRTRNWILCRLLFNAVKRPKKAACTSQKNASTEFCAKQEHDADCAQAFCGLVQQQGEIPTVGQNSRHEMQGIKSVFQTARRFRAHTTHPYMNVFKTIRELKWSILQNYWQPHCWRWV